MDTPSLYSTPRFYDKKVQEINTELSALSWLESTFPIVETGEDEEGTFPEAYKNDGSKVSYRVIPSGNSLAFYTLNDASQIEETEHYKCDFSLVVWADLTKADTTKSYNYTADLINDCITILNSHSCYGYTIDFEDILSDYSQLEKVINQNVMLPNTAFRINFSCDLVMCLSADTPLVF